MDALKIYEDALDELASDLITEDEFTKIIKCLRDVQEVKHGRWSISITTDLPPSETRYLCSVCGKTAKVKRGSKIGLNYCSYCGAKMDEEADNDKNTE